MMSKASFMMQENLRRNYVMITDVSSPHTFFVRGRLPFPQGLLAIAVLFKNQRPADVYAHPYFIEKQSDPSQPSPQLHLTEESQGIMKVMSGLRYMRDDNTKLDSTMVVVTDYKVEVEGRMPVLRSEAVAGAAPHGPAFARGQTRGAHTSTTSSPSPSASLTLEQRAHLRRAVHHVNARPGAAAGGGGGGGDAAAGTAMSSVVTPSGIPGYSTFPTPEDCATDPTASYTYLKHALHGRRTAAEPADTEESEPHAPARKRRQVPDVAIPPTGPPPPPHARDSDNENDVVSLFEKRSGGYTVLYNPIEVNERTFVSVLEKLKQEERVVKAIVVPTRPAWRHLQVWADVFPDAELISSGEVPLLPDDTVRVAADAATASPSRASAGGSATATEAPAPPSRASTLSSSLSTAWRGGCEDFGNGVTGLTFPEIDLEAEAAMERQRAADAAARAQATAAAAQEARHPASTRRGNREDEINEEEDAADGDAAEANEASLDAAARTRRAMLRRQRDKMRLRQEMREEDDRAAAAAAAAAASSSTLDSSQESTAQGHGGGDLVDVLWHDVSFFTENRVQEVGLRARDAARLRVLSPSRGSSITKAPSRTSSSSPASSTPAEPPARPVESLRLTPTIELLRVPGDAVTEEYVLYDANSRSLACTDLYHGAYADLDPANSWMCRVWFKFMKRGNYKRADRVPRYKWLQVMQQHSLAVLQRGLDELTRRRVIRYVIGAHGTPPLSGAEAVNTLRGQWNLPPLSPGEMPTTGGGRR